MSIKHEPGEGQHTLVRIEHTSWPSDGVRRVEFEDSDDQAGDNIAGVGWCIRWALDALRSGDDQYIALDLADALASLELDDDDDMRACDDTEKRLVRAMIDAAKELHEHRREKRKKKTTTDAGVKP